MARHVSAATITRLTRAAAFRRVTLPSVYEMIHDIRGRLIERVDSVKKSRSKYRHALNALTRFDRIVDNPPDGFTFAVVAYSAITQNDNARIWGEFAQHVRRPFRVFLGQYHAAKLRALGLCRHAINRMKEGLVPQDRQGNPYYVDIDHVMERHGSGKLSSVLAQDKLLPDSPPTARVNHFSNLVLLPRPVHMLKNDLNGLQYSLRPLKPGETLPFLMLVPDAKTAFVAPRQKYTHIFSGVCGPELGLNERIDYVSHLARQTRNMVEARDTPKPFVAAAVSDICAQLRIAFAEATQTKGKSGTLHRFADFLKKPALKNLPNDIKRRHPNETDRLRSTLHDIKRDLAKISSG